MILTEPKPKYGENNLSQCHFTTYFTFHMYFTLTDLGSKPGLRDDRQATNRLNLGTAT